MSSPLLVEQTQQLVRNRPRPLTYPALADAVTALMPPNETVTAAWLEQFATGRIKRPDATKVQRLHEYLTGVTLLK